MQPQSPNPLSTSSRAGVLMPRLCNLAIAIGASTLLLACANGSNAKGDAGAIASDDAATGDTPAVVETSERPAPNASAPSQGGRWEISAAGIGPVRAGMTLAEVKQTLGAGYQFQDIPNFMVDFGAIAVSQGGEPELYLVYFAADPIRDRDRVPFLMTDNPQYKTAAGVHPGMGIREAARRLGPATLNFNYDNEGREFVDFQNAPAALSFRTSGAPGNFAGIYGATNDGSGRTTRYHDDAAIQFIWVDVSRADRAADGAEAETEAEAPMGTAYATADRALNRTYQRLIATLDAAPTAELRTAERAWIVARDRQCDLVKAAGGDREGCLTTLTQRRTAELQQQLEGDGADATPMAEPAPSIGVVSIGGQSINCDNAQSTPEINACAERTAERVEAQRDQAIAQLRSQRPNLQPALNDANRAWNAFRDAHCEAVTAPNRGGTGFLAFLSHCQASVTQQQLIDLRQLQKP